MKSRNICYNCGAILIEISNGKKICPNCDRIDEYFESEKKDMPFVD